MGERTPLWDPLARGVIFGLSLNHSRGHVVRAMMESVTFALYHSFEIIRDLGRPVHSPIVLNEGGAKSRLWRQIITDVFNVPTATAGRATTPGPLTGTPFSPEWRWAPFRISGWHGKDPLHRAQGT